jgi:hypothetical protein
MTTAGSFEPNGCANFTADHRVRYPVAIGPLGKIGKMAIGATGFELGPRIVGLTGRFQGSRRPSVPV